MGAEIPNFEARPFSVAGRTALAANVSYAAGTNAIMSVSAKAPMSGILWVSLAGNCTQNNGSGWFVIDITGVAGSELRFFVHAHGATPDAAIPCVKKYTGLVPGQTYTINASFIVNSGTTVINAVSSPTNNHLELRAEG